MTTHVFVDESKQRGYLLAAAVVMPGDMDLARKAIRDLILPGQRRIHMKDESPPRKRLIASTIATSGVRATMYEAGQRYRNERERRRACFDALIDHLAPHSGTSLVIEEDRTLKSWDNQCLIEATRRAGCQETLAYRHGTASTDLLLSIPDALAWAWAKGGDWRRRIAPVVLDVHEV